MLEAVSGERLIRSLARKDDLHVLGGELRDVVKRNAHRITERLVGVPHELGQELGELGLADSQLVMMRAQRLGHLTRVWSFIEAATFSKRDRERVERSV